MKTMQVEVPLLIECGDDLSADDLAHIKVAVCRLFESDKPHMRVSVQVGKVTDKDTLFFSRSVSMTGLTYIGRVAVEDGAIRATAEI